jgi:hypothetical protein
MKTTTARRCVYPKDVQRITGKNDCYGRMLLLKIRESINKQGNQFISIERILQLHGTQNGASTTAIGWLIIQSSPHYFI